MSNYDIFRAIVTRKSICYDVFMSALFQKLKKKKSGSRHPVKQQAPEDIMDPILYSGGLDKEKYPQLALEIEHSPEEEIENPLNQRRN